MNVADLIGRCLSAAGATRVYGSSESGLAGLEPLGHVVVDEPAVAELLADAAGRIGPGPGVAALPDRTLRIGAAPGSPAGVHTVASVEEIPFVVAAAAHDAPLEATELRFDIDLDAPVDDALDLGPLTVDATGGRALVLDEELREVGLLILAGPGVVRAGAVDALRAVAARAACGVVNTWGAKGVFRWDSPHHYGTAGMQADDFRLAGFEEAQIVLAVGVDPLESPPERWTYGQVLDLAPAQLATLVELWSPPTTEVPPYPRLYSELAAALAPLYADDSVPLNPAKAAAELGAVRPAGALVAVDPGEAGLWIARAFPTTETGSVLVPSRPVQGFAAAAGVVSTLDGRTSIGVVTGEVDEATQAVIDLANRWGAQLVLEVWGTDGVAATGERQSFLAAALESRGTIVSPVAVDFSSTSVLTDVAGPVVAWT